MLVCGTCVFFLFCYFSLPSHIITLMYRVMVEAEVEVVLVGVGPVTVGVVRAEILTVPILVEVVLAEVCLWLYL